MNTKIKSLTSLKTLPLIGVFAISLVLSPTLAMADSGDRGRHKNQYSQDDRKSHSKANKYSNKSHYKSRGKSHKSNHGYSSRHGHKKSYGHRNDRAHYKHDHYDNHRGTHHTSYIVNDHHYSGYPYVLDSLGFMIGLHTNNFDIILRD